DAAGGVRRAPGARGGDGGPARAADGDCRGPARRRAGLPLAGPLRRLRRALRPPVDDDRPARRRTQRRRAVGDRAPRLGTAVLQAGDRRRGRARALARGGRSRAARAGRRGRIADAGLMRAAFLGPEGTYSHEALTADPRAADWEPIPMPTVFDAIQAVEEGAVERALVPI